MTKPFLITENIAVLLDITPRRVQQLVKELGIKPRKLGNLNTFTDAQYKKMRGRKNAKPGPKGKRSNSEEIA